jgi:hypothetical protein
LRCRASSLPKGDTFTQLFVNGKRRTLARYPNFDKENPYWNGKGYAHSGEQVGLIPDGFYFKPGSPPDRKWAKPQEAVVHFLHGIGWGSLHWRVKDIDWDKRLVHLGEGGWQMNTLWLTSACRISNAFYYIENVFEELDTPGEWYFDKKERYLYYWPEEGEKMEQALVEAPLLKQLVEFRGTQQAPVHHIALSGFRFAHTASVFLDPYEAPSLGDWTLNRSGAAFLEGSEDCTVENSFFDAVGGNALFISDYNRRARICANRITEAGESAICLLGTLNRTFGSNRPYPAECTVSNNYISNCGKFGKQVAGVFISRSESNIISHNEIHHMPRAGICINDGTWGGHIIEFNKVYDTCLESGDHGPFNSWGRDRYYCLNHSHGPDFPYHEAGPVKDDARSTTIIRNNYFSNETGNGTWGIDLDDGTSNYHIYSNLCVRCPIKFRDGDYRTVENNIIYKPYNCMNFSLSHVKNHDRFVRNIVVLDSNKEAPDTYDMTKMGKKGVIYHIIFSPGDQRFAEELDRNLFFNDVGEFTALISNPIGFGPNRPSEGTVKEGPARIYDFAQWKELGYDANSLFADPLFQDPEKGDFQLRPESPALKLGFVPFDLESFGLLPDFPEHWKNIGEEHLSQSTQETGRKKILW